MNTDNLLNDVHDVNLSYLLLMQRMIKFDRDMAMFRLDIDEDMADLVTTIPAEELTKLARCNQLLCQFSMEDATQISSLINTPNNDHEWRSNPILALSGHEQPGGNRRHGDQTAPRRAPYRRERNPASQATVVAR